MCVVKLNMNICKLATPLKQQTTLFNPPTHILTKRLKKKRKTLNKGNLNINKYINLLKNQPFVFKNNLTDSLNKVLNVLSSEIQIASNLLRSLISIEKETFFLGSLRPLPLPTLA